MPKPQKLQLVIYASHLNRIGGIETFCLNFCKRLADQYDITFAYDSSTGNIIDKISKHVKTEVLTDKKLTADYLVVATAWGKGPEGRIIAPIQVQMIHADFIAYIDGWNFKYKKLPNTTHHVAVSRHVATQFVLATPYNIDKVIYNML